MTYAWTALIGAATGSMATLTFIGYLIERAARRAAKRTRKEITR